MEQSMGSPSADLSRVMRPFALPIGLASPMWLAYSAAASVGVTWWWMSRMTRLTAPQMNRAETFASNVVAETVEAIAEMAPTPSEIVSAPMAVAADIETAVERPDELTLLRGVGPRVADALVARGVTTFAQLAAWSELEMAAFDKDLKLLGRSTRYDFIGQAREFAAA